MTRLALLWHQHQPCYVDLRRGEAAMPWVRLHGVKDYWGMPSILREFPGVKAHVNLVPGLILQVEAAAAGLQDPWLRLARIPAEDLTGEAKQAILGTFFMAHEDNLVRANPRYGELLAKARGADRWRPEALATGDWRDLQVWHNLAWFHPLLREENAAVKELFRKQRGFTEGDKEVVLAAQRGTLAGLVPLHRELQEAGQIEITTTPCWHPILPLLCRMESARVAMPNVQLPRAPALDMEDDARAQLARAVAIHRERFGRNPKGLWPSEGSVSPEMVALVEEAGFRWMATDEGVLESSLGADFRRDGRGVASQASDLYAPWRAGERLSIVFRDHTLSDLVGFEYKRAEAEAAAEDLVARIRAAGRAAGPDALVTLALDGENAWEHFPGLGVPFLRAFYRRLQEAKDISTVHLGQELQDGPPPRRLERLWSGSWIHRNFQIWVGHPEDNAGWELLGQARSSLLAATKAAGADPRTGPPPKSLLSLPKTGLDAAWESMFAAEGSDWFWWYGEEHFSPVAGTFDALFRGHLQNVWAALGLPVPPALLRPIKAGAARAPAWTSPWALLEVRIDGRRSDYYEWISAGHYASAKDVDVMDRSSAWIRDVYFGFDRKSLLVRVDTQGRAKDGLGSRKLAIAFVSPSGKTVTVGADGRAEGCGAAAAAAEIVEVCVPLGGLDVVPGERIEFFVEAASGPASQRVPAREPISVQVPSEDDDRVRWLV
ncbi:MAG: alpha-amylase/alpha-mannosidase [Planctomycetia bacterium]|nr:alpha-amylase/alpha-mannosidase [Planctomycetia bacterium]